MGDTACLAGTARAVLGVSGAALLATSAPLGAQSLDCPEPQTWARAAFEAGFERERRLSGLTVPLRSHGHVRSDGETLWWETEAPVEMVIRIDSGGVFQSVGGSPMVPLRAASGQAAGVASLIARILNGDFGAAEADFEVEQARDPASGVWRLSLVPASAHLARSIERIELTGCDRLATVLVEHPSGDQDRVTFSRAE